MFTFGFPNYLYLLLLVPALTLLFIWAQWSRISRLKKFGRPDIILPLMPLASKYMPWIKFCIYAVVTTLIILALCRPRITSGSLDNEDTETVAGIEVMLCVDVSNSMLASATDAPDGVSRMQRAKFIIDKLLNSMQNDKVGLIVFAGESYTQVPITSDYVSAKMFVNTLSPGMVPTQGTAIGTALEMAANSFTPESPFDKAIILITDAENFEDNAVEAASHIAETGIQIDVIGLGSSHPVPIPLDKSERKYMLDQQGETVLTALNEDEAQKIAKAGNGIYVNGVSSDAVSRLDDQLRSMKQTEFQRQAVSPENEQFPVLIWIALFLMTINIFIPSRKVLWLTKYTFFNK